MEILRSHDGRYTIHRQTDLYVIYDAEVDEHAEVWSCRTLTQLYAWMAAHGLSPADFAEI